MVGLSNQYDDLKLEYPELGIIGDRDATDALNENNPMP